MQRARKANAANDKAGQARREQEEKVEEKKEEEKERPRQKGRRRGREEEGGRGKRCAAGVHTCLKRCESKVKDSDLRGEARRRPARSDTIAASQRARARVLREREERGGKVP